MIDMTVTNVRRKGNHTWTYAGYSNSDRVNGAEKILSLMQDGEYECYVPDECYNRIVAGHGRAASMFDTFFYEGIMFGVENNEIFVFHRKIN